MADEKMFRSDHKSRMALAAAGEIIARLKKLPECEWLTKLRPLAEEEVRQWMAHTILDHAPDVTIYDVRCQECGAPPLETHTIHCKRNTRSVPKPQKKCEHCGEPDHGALDCVKRTS